MKNINNIGISSELDISRIRHIMKIGLVAAVYFLKKMYEYSPDTALEVTAKFLVYFLVPAMALFFVFFLILVVM